MFMMMMIMVVLLIKMMIMMMVWRQNQIGFDQNENSRPCLQYAQLLLSIITTPRYQCIAMVVLLCSAITDTFIVT